MSADGGPVSHVAGPRGEEEERAARLHAAAEAVADGGWPPAGLGDASADPLIPEFDIIARIAQVHQAAAGGRAATEDGRHSSESLGDILSRSVVPMTTRPDLTGAPRWGPLFVLERVGGGSFGEVYRAWDPALDREVALKLLRVPSTSPGRASTFVREGQLLASVRHPNVINVHGAAQIDGDVGLWMEFVRGRTLEQIVLEDGPMSAQEATVIAESLCRALSAVHQQGLLHRDIKAANVMRASGGRIVLLDFGTGTEAASSAGGSHGIAGTPLYMAPEVLEGAPATVQSDVYSLGVLMFFLVTGAFPVFDKSLAGVRSAHAEGNRVLLSDVRSDLPLSFVGTVEWAISHVQGNRPRSVGELSSSFSADVDSALDTRRLVAIVGTVAAAATVGVWMLGFVTSLAFNVTLGRGGPFAREPWTAYWIWGARALIAPAFSVAVAAVGSGVLWTVFRFSTGLTARLVGGASHSPRRNRVAARRWHLPTVEETVVVLELLLLLVLCWRFQSVFAAATRYASTADPTEFAVFQPRNLGERNLFSLCFSWGAFLSVASWAWLERVRRSGTRRVWLSTRATAMALAGLFVFLLVLPYRIGWHNDAERVQFESNRCYAVGATDSELLLYCPSVQPPRVRPMRADDKRIRRESIFESIFTP